VVLIGKMVINKPISSNKNIYLFARRIRLTDISNDILVAFLTLEYLIYPFQSNEYSMITRIFIMIALLLSTSIYAFENSEALSKPSKESITVKQVSEQLEGLTEKLGVVSDEQRKLKESIVKNIGSLQQKLTQIDTRSAEIDQFIKKQNLDYQSHEKRGVDFTLFMDSPNKPAWINFLAVIVSIGGSIGLSLFFLHKTLQRETTKQIAQITIDADKRTEEHEALLKAQKLQNDNLLTNQRQLSIDAHKEHHKVVIDEFRQRWINTFREEASSYVKVVIQLQHLYDQEKNILPFVKSLKRDESACAQFRADFREKNRGLPTVLTEENNEEYKELRASERNSKEDFESIKYAYSELKKLEAELINMKTQILFMLNPDKDVNSQNDKAFDNEILDCIKHINDSFISEQRTYQAFTNFKTIQEQIEEFQRIVPLMLKAEWDRVQRK
jgi:hypothetical protein